MSTQLQAFAPTIPELLAQYRRRLEADLDKAVDRWTKAAEAKDDAVQALAVFDAAMVAQHDDGMTDLEAADALVAALEPEQPPAKVAAEVQVFGELLEEALPDHGTVTVSGPGCEPFEFEVGSRTRFAALVFQYCERIGMECVLDEWRIYDEAGCNVLGSEVVPASAYGAAFTVERAS